MLKAYKSHNLLSDKINHGFFSRLGGVSHGLYNSLNLGLGSDDARDNVLENRALVAQDIGVANAKFLTLYQIHSADVVEVSLPWSVTQLPKADAMVTKEKGIALGILTADCVPVLFADHHHGVIAAAHAGWKGALGGVIKNTVAAMCSMGASPETISATVGPAIAKSSYEVGEEVRDEFLNKNPDFSVFFDKNPLDQNAQYKYQFDLCALVLSLLRQEKIESLEQIKQDTYQNSQEFFSFRRSTHKKESDYGRQISAICLKE